MLGVVRYGYRALPVGRHLTRQVRSLTQVPRVVSVPRNFIYVSQRRNYGIKVEQSTGDVVFIEPLKVLNQQKDKTLNIAERAASRLDDIYSDSKEVLRVLVESGGCHGFQYNMKLVPESSIDLNVEATKKAEQENPDADEFEEGGDAATAKDVIFVVSDKGGKVVIDETSLGILNNTTLNYTTELIGSTFKITDGNLKSSCGCGSSFDIEEDKV